MIKVTIIRPGNAPEQSFIVAGKGPIDQFTPKGKARGYTPHELIRSGVHGPAMGRGVRNPHLVAAMDLIENDTLSPHVISLNAGGDFSFPTRTVEGPGNTSYRFEYVTSTEESE